MGRVDAPAVPRHASGTAWDHLRSCAEGRAVAQLRSRDVCGSRPAGVASHLLKHSAMTRVIVLIAVVWTAACIDGGSTDRSGPLPPSTQAWNGCPWGSDCPDFLPCGKLGETDCVNRIDCEAVYDPSTTTPKFVACRDKSGPACRAAGEVCWTGADTECCPGLYCCGDGLSTAEEHCFAACPI
jgi:hypothetical protein